ncbi:hypothetical protein [Parapedobacter koreensis]|uniref:Uncharacterized protein n=1 Tax=Parapedobacter koreensis TaxID=332977 RepID=A0A1H7F3B9_9SPHI|nr:hypothetical protein [Parapedobacter koreensis]SEK17615.1 hypothetical protein SAMN05421740_1017 [Parapedobacter koreensis]
MDLYELKNLLESEERPKKDRSEIRTLLSAKPHPVLRNVRRQVIIEAIAWGGFLFLVYTAFDADTKPLWLGLLIVLTVSAYLIHLLAGYAQIVAMPADKPLAESLSFAYRRMRRFAMRNLLLRSLLLAAVLFFFGYGISFTPGKYGALLGIAVVFIVQLLLNRGLWLRRLRRLRDAVAGLTLWNKQF